jgi:hypothetical protein
MTICATRSALALILALMLAAWCGPTRSWHDPPLRECFKQ